MANVQIQKSIAGKHETAFKVPLFFFRIATRLLPESALRSLALRGFDVREIVVAASGTPYHSIFHVRERGLHKQVAVTLRHA